MNCDELKKFLYNPITTEKDLIDFIHCVSRDVRIVDEGLIFGFAVRCGSELWRLPTIQSLIKKTKMENYSINVVCRLLCGSEITVELTRGLKFILASRAIHNFAVTQLLVRFHRERMINAKEFLLSLLHWYSPIRLWETALTVFSICEPSLLHDRRLTLVPRLRSAEFRVLSDLLLSNVVTESAGSGALLSKAAQSLRRLGSRKHSFVVLQIAQISVIYNSTLAASLAREMKSCGDTRDLNLFEPLLRNSQKV